jgi:hypothetical protein
MRHLIAHVFLLAAFLSYLFIMYIGKFSRHNNLSLRKSYKDSLFFGVRHKQLLANVMFGEEKTASK